jgi:hypothetical protein
MPGKDYEKHGSSDLKHALTPSPILINHKSKYTNDKTNA